MLFNSLGFLALFLPVVYFVFWKCKTAQARFIWLTLSGYFFYGQWSWSFCLLMLFSTLASFIGGQVVEKFEGRKRLSAMWSFVCLDLSLLLYFKYSNFFITNLNKLTYFFGSGTELTALDVILPVGISFYTFHTISYIVDVYRNRISACRNFFEYSTYVSLFSQLVAGPIVRFSEIENDLKHISDQPKQDSFNRGFLYLLIGLVKKVVIADTLARFVNQGFQQISALSWFTGWVNILGYSYQLYFDFSGYSDMAIGLGLMFGLSIPINFNSPYKAVNFSDFWNRWHISLSSWLRDYLYIPLGGNRVSRSRVLQNLMITMLLGGLWHGASWNFILWGVMHGIFLVGQKLINFQSKVLTFLMVTLAWIPFRTTDFQECTLFFGRLFAVPAESSYFEISRFFLVAVLAAAVICHRLPNSHEFIEKWSKANKPYVVFIPAMIIIFILIAVQPQTPFLYFQF